MAHAADTGNTFIRGRVCSLTNFWSPRLTWKITCLYASHETFDSSTANFLTDLIPVGHLLAFAILLVYMLPNRPDGALFVEEGGRRWPGGRSLDVDPGS